MTFAYPWILLACPLILLAITLRRRGMPAPLLISSHSLTDDLPRSIRLTLRTPVLRLLSIAAIAAASAAAARPQLITAIPQPRDARNLVLSLDLSRSMETPDFNRDGQITSRLVGVKSVVDDLLKERSGDRIGVVVFGVRAFLQAPLTLDHTFIAQMVQTLRCGVAGDGTAIGDGLGLSVKRLQKKSHGTRAIILITDGVNNSGNVNPLKAAQIAKDLGIKIHTIGIGSTEPIPQQFLGNFFPNLGGQTAEFDEKLLKEVAAITGGKYSSASSSQDLREIYREIELLDRSAEDSASLNDVQELFEPFAWIAILSYAALVALSRTFFLKVPVV